MTAIRRIFRLWVLFAPLLLCAAILIAWVVAETPPITLERHCIALQAAYWSAVAYATVTSALLAVWFAIAAKETAKEEKR